jgi:hypothetical protein
MDRLHVLELVDQACLHLLELVRLLADGHRVPSHHRPSPEQSQAPLVARLPIRTEALGLRLERVGLGEIAIDASNVHRTIFGARLAGHHPNLLALWVVQFHPPAPLAVRPEEVLLPVALSLRP